MAKETGSKISFQDAANVSRRVEVVLSQGSGQGSDKRPRHSSRLSGASSGGRDSFGRGHPPMPFHSALQAFHGASGGCGSYMQYSDQLPYSAPLAPISAPPSRVFGLGTSEFDSEHTPKSHILLRTPSKYGSGSVHLKC